MIERTERPVWLVAAIVLPPALYVLSSGPAYGAWMNGVLPDALFELVYEPLFGLLDRLGVFRYVSWYYDLFEG